MTVRNLPSRKLIALAVADHQRNVSDCDDGMQSCDRSKLTPAEARDSSTAERLRNIADCKDGVGNCDHSQLTAVGSRTGERG